MTEKRWIMLENGRSVYRSIGQAPVARSSFPCPRIVSDTVEPIQSMADGKFYTSLSALRRTYRADSNPQGEEYIEVGNEKLADAAPQFDKSQRVEDIKCAMHDVLTGNIPPEIAAIQ